jgi:hypothetical protein
MGREEFGRVNFGLLTPPLSSLWEGEGKEKCISERTGRRGESRGF